MSSGSKVNGFSRLRRAGTFMLAAVTFGGGVIGAVGDPEAAALETAVAPLRDKLRRPAPSSAPSRVERERIALGRALFFDSTLSGKRDLSCASCHDPNTGWTDTLSTARGTGGKVLGRRTQTLFDLAEGAAFFWDGRAGTLEEQALGPVQSPDEMNLPLPELRVRLAVSRRYQELAQAAFGEPVLSTDRAAEAIAAFERTIQSPRSAFDRWADGDVRAISDDAKRGLLLFTGKANCATCHSGWRFTDDSFHDIGTTTADRGRGGVLEEIEAVQYAFKTPTLRGIVGRGPYLHDGSSSDLADVIALYNEGGRVKRPSLSGEIRPLGLSAPERAQLLAFLQTLGDARQSASASTSSR
jgi:cytochrome c peroxidase